MFSFGSIIGVSTNNGARWLHTVAPSNHKDDRLLMATSDTTTKRCSRGDQCLHPEGPNLPATTKYFHRKGDGLRAMCKACRKPRTHEYYEANKDDILIVNQAYRDAHPEAMKGYQEAYVERHSERVLASKAQYYQSHKSEVIHRTMRQRIESPEKYEARKAVQLAVMSKTISPIKACICMQCGKPAQHYHHWKGYEPAHWLDVIPLCAKCHRKVHVSS